LFVSDMHCRKPCVSVPQIIAPPGAPAAPLAATAGAPAAPEPEPLNMYWLTACPAMEPAIDEAIVPIIPDPAEAAAAGGAALCAIAGGGADGLGAYAAGAAARGGAAIEEEERAPAGAEAPPFLRPKAMVIGSGWRQV